MGGVQLVEPEEEVGGSDRREGEVGLEGVGLVQGEVELLPPPRNWLWR